MITTFDSTRIAFIAKNATLPHRDGQVWLCLRQRQKFLADFFGGIHHIKSQMAGTGQGRSNQAQQHSNGSVAQLDRAADF
jgi:hypothetical protein